MRKVVFLLFTLLLSSCYCKYYHVKNSSGQIPVTMEGANRPISVCDDNDEQISIRISDEKKEYQITKDSLGYGYTANICYRDRANSPHLRVGSGSEFEVGKCRFRVVEVLSFHNRRWLINPNDSNDVIRLAHKILLQRLTAPPRCCCANKSLKDYDATGLEPDWLQKLFQEDWED